MSKPMCSDLVEFNGEWYCARAQIQTGTFSRRQPKLAKKITHDQDLVSAMSLVMGVINCRLRNILELDDKCMVFGLLSNVYYKEMRLGRITSWY